MTIKTKDKNVPNAGTLPDVKVDVKLLKDQERNALMNRKITPKDCKHLTGEEIVRVLLNML